MSLQEESKQQWEYCIVGVVLRYPYDMANGLMMNEVYLNGAYLVEWQNKPLFDFLNHQGHHGWELIVSESFTTLVFKRRVGAAYNAIAT